MNRRASLYLAGLAGLAGCSGNNVPLANSDAPSAATSPAANSNEAVNFVTLKVPNMH